MSTTEDEAKLLFRKVEKILKEEKQLSKLRGEHFNIFRLLDWERKEPEFHTKFLFELLNPRGSHGLGAVFFDEFIGVLKNDLSNKVKIPVYKSKEISAEREVNIGRVNVDDQKGGRIDLYFETDTFALAIENKIYSGLGYSQLERYQNFLIGKKKSCKLLILLSPFGQNYKGKLIEGKDFYQLKYRDLIPWLQICMEKAADFPILRETIKQYLISVKGILGMLTNKEMNEKLKDLILKNYETAKQISETFQEARDIRVHHVYEKILGTFKDRFTDDSWDKDLDVETISSKDHGFWLRHHSWSRNMTIIFQGNRKLEKGMVPTILIDRMNDNEREILENHYGTQLKDYSPNHPLHIDFRGKFQKLDQLFESGKDTEAIAQELLDYVLEMFQKLEGEVLKIEKMLG